MSFGCKQGFFRADDSFFPARLAPDMRWRSWLARSVFGSSRIPVSRTSASKRLDLFRGEAGGLGCIPTSHSSGFYLAGHRTRFLPFSLCPSLLSLGIDVVAQDDDIVEVS